MRSPGYVLLDGLLGCPHCDQDASVGRHDDTAGQNVAEDEERQGVGASRVLPVGHVPVDAAGRAVGLGSVRAPAGQRGAGEEQGVDPGAGDQQAAVNRVKPVTWTDGKTMTSRGLKSRSRRTHCCEYIKYV